MVEGYPILLSSVNTMFGQYKFYALRDSTGQIAVDENKFGIFSENTTFGLVGTIGEVCVHGAADETFNSWKCGKKELGLVTNP